MFYGYDEEKVIDAVLEQLEGNGSRIGFPLDGVIFQEEGKEMHKAEMPNRSSIIFELDESHLEEIQNNKECQVYMMTNLDFKNGKVDWGYGETIAEAQKDCYRKVTKRYLDEQKVVNRRKLEDFMKRHSFMRGIRIIG